MSAIISGQEREDKYAAFLKVWARIQYELLVVFWGLMDVALLTPFFLSFMRWARYWPPGQFLLWLLLLMLFSFNFTRLLSVMQLSPDRQRLINAAALLFTIFLAIRGFVHTPASLFDFSWIRQFLADVAETNNSRWLQDISLFGIIIVIWQRGIRLTAHQFDISRIGLKMRAGGLLFAPFIVWLSNRWLIIDVTPFLLLFFLAALTAVSLIRAEELEQDRSKKSVTLDPRWLTMIFLIAGLTILTGGFLTILITGETAGAVVGWLAPLIISLQFTFSVAFSTLFFITIPLLQLLDMFVLWLSNIISGIWNWITSLSYIISKIVSKLVEPRPRPETDAATNEPPATPELLIERLNLGELNDVSHILVILLMVAVILIVALMVSGAYKSTRFAEQESNTLSRTSRIKPKDNLLNRLLQRLGLLQNWRAAASIRRVYRHMLRAADASGYPRLDSETPYEFLSTLGRAWPNYASETELITTAYVKVRYGELPETKAELDAILEAWDVLEQAPPETAVTENQ